VPDSKNSTVQFEYAGSIKNSSSPTVVPEKLIFPFVTKIIEALMTFRQTTVPLQLLTSSKTGLS